MTDAAAQDGGEVVPQPGLLAVLDGAFGSERVTLVDTSGRVVVDLGAAVWAEWSADGALIAYQQVDRKDTVPVASRLVVAASDGADPVVVAEGPRWAWSPSGDQLFTTEWDSLTDTTTTYVVNSDGTDHRAVFEGSPLAWSPDGSRIVFNTDHDDPTFGQDRVWWIHELTTGVNQRVGTFESQPSWSPDSTRLVGAGDPGSPLFTLSDGVWIFDLASATAAELLAEGASPVWAPRGDLIAYHVAMSPCCGEPVLRIVDAETKTESQPVSPDPQSGFATGGIFWSPTGEQLVVVWENGLANDTVALHHPDGSVIWDSGSLMSTFSGGLPPIEWAPDGSGFVWPVPSLADTWQFVSAIGLTGNIPIAGWVIDWQAVFPQDISSSVFQADIEWLWSQRITRGCNPPWNDHFCPRDTVTRGQMAAFLVRALGLTDQLDDPFSDDDESIFEADIEKLAAAGITKGCNPPVNDRFCPDSMVNRGQMAAFLVRAIGYVDDGGGDLFIDDDGSIFENDIDKLGTAAVTKGCNPPVNDMYCPGSVVTRGQMAAFLHRALG
jgi:Tol biopolymer transport system component